MYKYLYILNDIENMIKNGEIREGKKLLFIWLFVM